MKDKNRVERSKPPLGCMPRHLWRAKRIADLICAIARHIEAGVVAHGEWLDELAVLMAENERESKA